MKEANSRTYVASLSKGKARVIKSGIVMPMLFFMSLQLYYFECEKWTVLLLVSWSAGKEYAECKLWIISLLYQYGS